MPAYLALVRGLLRSTLRNRQALFWTFFSPLLLMVVFSFLGNQASAAKVYVAREPGPVYRAVARVVGHAGAVTLVPEPSLDAALAALRGGRLDAVLVPPDAMGGTEPARLTAYVNTTNYIQAQQTEGLVAALVAETNQALVGRPPALTVRFRAVAGRTVSYLDFLVPGILALMAMNNSLFGLAGTLTRWKEKGVLRRFLATPLPPVVFLGATVTNQLVTGLVSLAIILAVAVYGLHAHETLPLLPLTALLVLGVACFLALGFLIGGVARTQEAVMPLVNLVAFPMMFLSGVFFPLSTLPPFLRHLVGWFPLTFLVDGLRRMMNAGVAWNGDVTRDVLGLAGWLAVIVAATSRTWRWE